MSRMNIITNECGVALVEDEDGLARENGLEIYYRDVAPYLTRLRLKFPEIATLIVVV